MKELDDLKALLAEIKLSAKTLKDETEDWLTSPITCDVVEDQPISIRTDPQHIYNQYDIKSFKGLCPITRNPISDNDIVPFFHLKKLKEQFELAEKIISQLTKTTEFAASLDASIKENKEIIRNTINKEIVELKAAKGMAEAETLTFSFENQQLRKEKALLKQSLIEELLKNKEDYDKKIQVLETQVNEFKKIFQDQSIKFEKNSVLENSKKRKLEKENSGLEKENSELKYLVMELQQKLEETNENLDRERKTLSETIIENIQIKKKLKKLEENGPQQEKKFADKKGEPPLNSYEIFSSPSVNKQNSTTLENSVIPLGDKDQISKKMGE